MIAEEDRRESRPTLRRRQARELPAEKDTTPAFAEAACSQPGGGGDYRGKFSPADIIVYEENRPVLKRFCLFSILLAVLPVVAFKATERLLRISHAMSFDGAAPIAAAAAIGTISVITGLYAFSAYQQEKADYAAVAREKVNS